MVTHNFRRTLTWLFLGTLLGVTIIVMLLWSWLHVGIPPINEVIVHHAKHDVILVDDIPEELYCMVVAHEDYDYYRNDEQYGGIGFVRAIISRITCSDQGCLYHRTASIPEAVVVRVLNLEGLDLKQSLRRDLRDLYLTVLYRRRFSKDEILSYHLQLMAFNGDIIGMQNASHIYFEKEITELTLAEMSALYALVNMYDFDPTDESSVKLVEDKMKSILDTLLANDCITISEYEEASNEKVLFSEDGLK